MATIPLFGVTGTQPAPRDPSNMSLMDHLTNNVQPATALDYGVQELPQYDGTYGAAPTPVVDPFAQWGGQTNYNNLRTGIQTGLGNIRTSSNEAFDAGKTSLQGDAENLFNKVRTGQLGINNSRSNNELNRINGIQDILGYVRSGIRQGVSRLSNNNALESSAAGALAGAYGQVGNQKSRSVNNQSALQSRQLDQNQNELNLQKTAGVTDFHRARDTLVNNIGADLRQKLSELDQKAIGLSLPDRIAVDQERQALIDAGMGQLQQVDNWLQSQLGTVNPQSQEDTARTANELRLAGTATANPFDLGTMSGQQLQNPAIDQLPIYTRYKRQS